MKHLLPLSTNQDEFHGFWEIRDNSGVILAQRLTKEEAEFLVTVANAHYGLVEELAKRMYAADAINKIVNSATKVISWDEVGIGQKQVWYDKAIAQAKAEEGS